MKEFMDKEIVERERAGHRYGEDTSRMERRTARQRLREGDEDFDVRRGIKAHVKGPKRNRKDLNENLNPLYGFLQKSVGRPWDKVFSEMCERISLNSTVQRHILEHVKWAVETNIRIIDGKPHEFSPYSYNRDQSINGYVPLTSWRSGRRAQLYVDPRDGILKKAPVRKDQANWRDTEKEERAKNRYCPSETRLIQYYRIDGIWYEIKFREPSEDEKARRSFGYYRKTVSGSMVYIAPKSGLDIEQFFPYTIGGMHNYSWQKDEFARLTSLFGRPMLPIGKRQLNTKEIRRVEEAIAKIIKSERIRRAA